MRGTILLVTLSVLALLSGCSGGGDSQSAFYHNNRETGKWVANPSHTPKYRNPNTGGPMFY